MYDIIIYNHVTGDTTFLTCNSFKFLQDINGNMIFKWSQDKANDLFWEENCKVEYNVTKWELNRVGGIYYRH